MQTRTRRQREIYEYVVDYIERHGHQPSYQMIARHFGIASRAGVGKHIKALENQGLLLRRRENGSFILQIGAVPSPVPGEYAVHWLDDADPSFTSDEPEGEPFTVPGFMRGNMEITNLVAFRIEDDSMTGKGIFDGDVVLIERRSHARDGDLVLVSVRKRRPILRNFYRDGSKVELRSVNGDIPIERLSGEIVEILGVYRGLFRASQ